MNTEVDTRSPEAAVLGSLILEPGRIEATKEDLTPDMFYHPDNQIVFKAICEHANQGLDIVILKTYLHDRDELAKVGGVKYLVDCTESVPSAANLEYYCNIVKEQHATRQIQQHAAAAIEISNNPKLKGQQKLDSIENDFRERLGGNRNQQDTGDKLTELLEDTISGKRTAIHLPWETTAALTNCLLPGTVTLLCGNPGASKSFMLLQALMYWLKLGVRCCCYELEESIEYHQLRVLAQMARLQGLTKPDWVFNHPDETRQAYKAHHDELEALRATLTAEPDRQVTLQQLAFWVDRKARDGHRVICIDPVTLAAYTRRDSWNEDGEFVEKIKRVATDYKCSVVIVSHPTKQNAGPGLESLAGGAAYSRFCQTAIWLEYHDMKESVIRTACGRTTQQHNRTLHLLKSRNGSGQGAKLAFMFGGDSLTLKEIGLIIPKGKQ